MDNKIIWAAGFFDGEGCIIIKRVHPGNRHSVRIQVSQVNPAPIKILKELFGGHISFQTPKNKDWSSQWKWEQDSKSAVETLVKLLPYLVVKRDVAELAIQFQNLKRKGVKTTPELLTLEQGFKDKISALNQKD